MERFWASRIQCLILAKACSIGKPFAQLQQAGMKTAVMDEILRQRDPDLKAAVEASLAGEIGRAFDRLGANVAEVNPDNIAGAVAARWLKLSPEERARTGVLASSYELREGINAHIRERLAREGRIAGPALETQQLISKSYTNAEKALASRTTPPATWSRSTAPTSAPGSKRATNDGSGASITRHGPSISKARTARPSPGSRRKPAGGRAAPRSTAPRPSNCAPALRADHDLRDLPLPGRSLARHPRHRLRRRPARRRHRGGREAAGRTPRPLAQPARMGGVGGRAGAGPSCAPGRPRRRGREGTQGPDADQSPQRPSPVARRRARGSRHGGRGGLRLEQGGRVAGITKVEFGRAIGQLYIEYLQRSRTRENFDDSFGACRGNRLFLAAGIPRKSFSGVSSHLGVRNGNS